MNLTIKKEWYEIAETMSDILQRAAFYEMVARYFFSDEVPNAKDHAGKATESSYIMFMLIRPEIDREKHEKELRRSKKETKRQPNADRKTTARRPPANQTATAEKQKTARFIKPTAEEITAYCKEKGYSVNAEQFISYYESNGWRVGHNPMKNWQAAVTNWAKRQFDAPRNKPAGAMWYKENEIPDEISNLF